METMTVKQVAEALGLSRSQIENTIKEIMPNKMRHGVTTYLSDAEVTAIKIHNEKNPYSLQLSGVKTDLEKKLLIMQAMNFLQEEIDDLNKTVIEKDKQIETLKPKAIFYDRAMDTETLIPMNEAAAVLALPGIGRNKLFAFLRQKGVLMANNIPYSEHIKALRFKVIEEICQTAVGEKIYLKTMVYQRGLDYILQLWNHYVNANKTIKKL
jgi:phage antirepressor YoqD-like protein